MANKVINDNGRTVIPIEGLVPGQIIQIYTTSKLTDLFVNGTLGSRGRTDATYTVIDSNKTYTNIDLSNFTLITNGTVYCAASSDTIVGTRPGDFGGHDTHMLTVDEMPAHRHRVTLGQAKWGDNANVRNFINFQSDSNGDSDYTNNSWWNNQNYTRYAGGTSTSDKVAGQSTVVDMRQSTMYVITMAYAPQ
jgi:hypothetical protein